ncbi:MAG: transglycosylase SLT domain-containing protein [Muribaculaceae bacterium]|nr:transglycosylase SLT domain-containing protein [Muribaculaceae bacterium]
MMAIATSLRNLDNEVGGGIIVKTISQDTLITEDLIELVAQKRLPLTVVDSDIAMLNSTYYSNIDVSLEVSFPQRAAWAVARHNTALADSINAWIETDAVAGANKAVLKRYFEMSKNNPITTQPAAMMLDERHGIVSRYDQIFRRHGAETGLDWRLLAAFSWVETRFTEGKESWAGARGIMQLMPRTAANFGVSGRDIDDPDKNVMAAARYLKELDKIFASRVTDPTERAKFVAAAYNSGHGHVLDAIALAQKYGLNPQRWEANVEMAILWKSKPEYFNDEVCRNGYFRGTETVAFVQKIADAYATFRAKAKN